MLLGSWTDMVLGFLLFPGSLFICGFLSILFDGGNSSSNRKTNTRTYNTRNNNKVGNRRDNRRNYYGHGPYDPGEYYSEWGDDGGYE